MKCEGEESTEQVEEGNMPGDKVLKSKTPSSEKSKTQLLRGGTIFLKDELLPEMLKKHKLMRSKKKKLLKKN